MITYKKTRCITYRVLQLHSCYKRREVRLLRPLLLTTQQRQGALLHQIVVVGVRQHPANAFRRISTHNKEEISFMIRSNLTEKKKKEVGIRIVFICVFIKINKQNSCQLRERDYREIVITKTRGLLPTAVINRDCIPTSLMICQIG